MVNKIKEWIQSWMSAKTLQNHFSEMTLENVRVMSIQQMSFMETMDYNGENFDQLKALIKTCFVVRSNNSHRLMLYSLIAFVPDNKLNQLVDVLLKEGNSELSEWISAEVKRRHKAPDLTPSPSSVSAVEDNKPHPVAPIHSELPPAPSSGSAKEVSTSLPKAGTAEGSSNAPKPQELSRSKSPAGGGDAWERVVMHGLATMPIDYTLSRMSLEQLKKHAGENIGDVFKGDEIFKELQKKQATADDYKEIFISYINYSKDNYRCKEVLFKMDRVINFDTQTFNELKECFLESENFKDILDGIPNISYMDLDSFEFLYPFEYPSKATVSKIENANRFNKEYIARIDAFCNSDPSIRMRLKRLTFEHIEIARKNSSDLPTIYK